jgi:uncharacterized membrane protein
MNAVDAVLLVLLSLADFSLIAYLRIRRSRKMRVKRMYRSLNLALRREVAMGSLASRTANRPRRIATVY